MSYIFFLTFCTREIITRGFYYFSIFSRAGFSLMFGGIPMKLGGYKMREVAIRARLVMASVRYLHTYLLFVLVPLFTIGDITDTPQ